VGSLTTWNRLEPATRNESLPGLAARIGDPLWLLGRQQQAGELAGSDTASIVSARLDYEVAPISRWVAGEPAPGTVGSPYPAGVPIEALVDSVQQPVGRLERAAGGRRFLRRLGDALATTYGAAVRREFAMGGLDTAEVGRSDDLGMRWSGVLAGRSVDGAALRAAPAAPDPASVRVRVGVADADADAFDAVLADFAAWWDGRHAAPAGAWRADRLASPFAVGAMTGAGPVTLKAPAHRGGRVDWHSFDVALGALATGDPAPVAESITVLPGQLTFPGMPAPRWWEFENGTVDLGGLEAAPDDLGRLLLAEFALVYGNDFFAVPLTLPTGSISRVTTLEVRTTYGETARVEPAAVHDGASGQRWRMFQVSDGSPDTDKGVGLLVLPPCAVDVLDGPVEEEVLLTRDETANAAWGIELRVTGPVGMPVERREVEAAAGRRGSGTPVTDSTLRYRLSTRVPESWLPLLTTADGLGLEQSGTAIPAGTLLSSAAPFRLDTVELPRVGRRVTRRTHAARGVNGTTHVWTGWTTRSGRGESSSGLRYDDLTHETDS
jgi:hypothetical protein